MVRNLLWKICYRYEREGKGRKTIKAQQLWYAIIESQIETGTPYMLYKDACNSKSNQKNLGTIKSSNLCTEIVEYTSPDEVAVCNLASISLPRFVTADKKFDFDQLQYVTSVIVRNLNRIIDINYYPIEEVSWFCEFASQHWFISVRLPVINVQFGLCCIQAANSNKRHRPIGVGVQGLADAFILMRYPFDSDEARELNKRIFATIYYACLRTSCRLAQEDGPYETFYGSPASKGVGNSQFPSK